MRDGTIPAAAGAAASRPACLRTSRPTLPVVDGWLASIWFPPMADLTIDPYVDLYADRMTGMTASEVRALFAVASRPDVVSLAGGMPFVSALPGGDVQDVVLSVLRDHGSSALQYCGGIGLL